jgi:hypothetical protein
MSAYSWGEVLVEAQTAGANLTASTTATSLLPTAAVFTLPAGFFSRPGKMLKILATGQLGNIVTTPGTLTIDVQLGGSVVAFNGGAVQLSSTAHTALPFWLEIILTCRSIGNGTSATLMGQGRMTAQSLSLTAVADSTTTPATLLLPNTTPAVGTGFDSTVSQKVDLRGTFSLSNANAIQLQTYALIAMN